VPSVVVIKELTIVISYLAVDCFCLTVYSFDEYWFVECEVNRFEIYLSVNNVKKLTGYIRIRVDDIYLCDIKIISL
jgi:hypothetical protein